MGGGGTVENAQVRESNTETLIQDYYTKKKKKNDLRVA